MNFRAIDVSDETVVKFHSQCQCVDGSGIVEVKGDTKEHCSAVFAGFSEIDLRANQTVEVVVS